MKKIAILFFLTVISTGVWAYDAGIAVITDKGTTMQVFVNGKLYNKQPVSFVRVKSVAGLYHVEVKVFNPKNKTWYTVKKDIHVSKGFEFHYKVVFVNSIPELVEVKKYPVYSRYFLNPNLYNKHSIS